MIQIEPIGMATVPDRVYHGTGANIDEFRLSRSKKNPRSMLWFASDASVAHHYAHIRTEGRQKPRLYAVDLDWGELDRIPMFERDYASGVTYESYADWAREHGYPAFWMKSPYAEDTDKAELVIIDPRKVRIEVASARQLDFNRDHEGFLSNVGLALAHLQREHGGRLSQEECAEKLKEKFADDPDRARIYEQIDTICEQRARAFVPDLEHVRVGVDEYTDAGTHERGHAAMPAYQGARSKVANTTRSGRGRLG